MEQLIQGAEVLMRSSRHNFIALYDCKANNKDGGWMLLLGAALCLSVGTASRNTEALNQANRR